MPLVRVASRIAVAVRGDACARIRRGQAAIAVFFALFCHLLAFHGWAGKKPWAYEQIREPFLTAPKSTWCRRDLDRLVLANIENAGLQPSPAADPGTLLRRVSLDL